MFKFALDIYAFPWTMKRKTVWIMSFELIELLWMHVNRMLFCNNLYALTCDATVFRFKFHRLYTTVLLVHIRYCHCQILSTFLMLAISLVRRSKSCHNIPSSMFNAFQALFHALNNRSVVYFQCKINRSSFQIQNQNLKMHLIDMLNAFYKQ